MFGHFGRYTVIHHIARIEKYNYYNLVGILSVQERLSKQIAEAVVTAVQPFGVAVNIEAT